jgi:hypothetical protein
MNSQRFRRPGGAAIGLVILLAALGAAVAFRPGEDAGLRLANPDPERVREIRLAFDRDLPANALVLVGMDADLGTYPEIRPATRAAFADLLDRGARLAFVSYTPEGRAIAVAELARLREAATRPNSLLDLGYVTGSEAGIVRTVTDLLPAGATGSFAEAVRGGGAGMSAFNLALVVSGSDLGARSWMEQVSTRLPELPIVAIAPTFAQPELQPYLRTGQLTGMLATVRDDAAYVDAVAADLSGAAAGLLEASPAAGAVFIGMLVALGILTWVVVRGIVGPLRARAAE